MARGLALLALSALVFTVAGCSSAAAPEDEVDASTAEVSLPTEEDIAAYLEVDCPNIISASVTKVLHDGGWTAAPESPWVIGDLTFADSLLCVWSSGEGDTMEYGWAQATTDEVSQLRESLDSQDWEISVDEAGETFTDTATGATYLVSSSGEVRFSTTLDGAHAVNAP